MSTNSLAIPAESAQFLAERATANTVSTRLNAASIRAVLKTQGLAGKALRDGVTAALRSTNQAMEMRVAHFKAKGGVVMTHCELKINKRTGAEELVAKWGTVASKEEVLQKENESLKELCLKVMKGEATRDDIIEFNKLTGGDLPVPPEPVEIDSETEELDDEA